MNELERLKAQAIGVGVGTLCILCVAGFLAYLLWPEKRLEQTGVCKDVVIKLYGETEIECPNAKHQMIIKSERLVFCQCKRDTP